MKTIKIQFSELSKQTKTPIFAYCRKLIKDGEDPDTRLEIFRDTYSFDIAVPKIGVGAKLTIREEPRLQVVWFKEPRVPQE